MSPFTDVIKGEPIITPFKEFDASPENQLRIGVEATAYIQNMIDEPPAHEPLLAALGGEPLALKIHIRGELDRWEKNHMVPLFVFDGQSIPGQSDITLQKARKSLVKTQEAWDLYSKNKPNEAVVAFGTSGAIRAKDLYAIFQDVLAESNLHYEVAPFSACAQLAILDQMKEQYIDGIMGSQELLLYNIYDGMYYPPSVSEWDKQIFSGVSKKAELQRLKVTPDLFLDALLMVGTSFLPPFPPLAVAGNVQDAVTLLNASTKSIEVAFNTYHDDIKLQDPNWLDKFRKARMWVMHAVTTRPLGENKTQEYDTLTVDNHEYLGLRLPEELHHYLAKGLIGPRIMDPFVSLESVVYPTLDGSSSEKSEDYRRLVTKSLIPLKEITLGIISSRINRAFQFKPIKMRFWFDAPPQDLTHRNVGQQVDEKLKTWAVVEEESWGEDKDLAENRFFSFATSSLQKAAEKTINPNPKAPLRGMTSEIAILATIIYSILHLRNYIDDRHQLTIWGEALATTLKAIKPIVEKYGNQQHVEDAVFLAYELLQFKCLNARNVLDNSIVGYPLRGSREQKESCLLISRTACLLQVRHQPIGYTGPLSQNFLSFYSLIKAVRETDRDLMEATAASMLLSGQIDKSRDDAEIPYRSINKRLPLGTDINISMGIAVKTYLDDFLNVEESRDARRAARVEYGHKYLPKGINISEDLDVAFDFFEALYKGVKTLGSEISEADMKAWETANEYLAERRC